MSLETLRALAKDIAESEKALRHAESEKDEVIHLMQQMLDHSPKMIIWKNISGQILGCNTACLNVLDLSKEEIIGKDIDDLFTGDDQAIFSAADRIALSQGEYEYDISFRTPTGKIIDAHVNVWRSANLCGETTGLIIFAYSMTPSGALTQ